MAEFTPALEFLLPHEGGYVDDAADPGGETNFGISKRSFPQVDIRNLTRDGAADIYRSQFWNPQRYAELVDQAVANKVFDLAVNMGFAQAHRILQQACCDCGSVTMCDGKLGATTLFAANSVQYQPGLVDAMRKRARDFYRVLALKRPSNSRFLEGWLRRANA